MFEKAAKLSQLFFFVWSLDLACYGNFSPSQIPENVTTLYCNISGGVANFGNNPTFVGGEHGACGKYEFFLLKYEFYHLELL